MRINTKSIAFRIALLYVIATVLNLSVFVILVFENQLDLIAENSILKSQYLGSRLKYQIDKTVAAAGELDPANVDRICRESNRLGFAGITLYDESGGFLAAMENGQPVARGQANELELKSINVAITKREFEDKLFYHQVDRQASRIELFIPFAYRLDQVAVAAASLVMKDARRQMSYLYRQVVWIAVLIILIHSLFAVIVSRMLLRPLRTLTRATQEISRGRLDTRVPLIGDDELGQLANSFNEMSVALQAIRDEAKEANPLTGLPGNTQIATRLERRFTGGSDFCLIYIDIDNFKAYNDRYGFAQGDKVLLFTRDCVRQVASAMKAENLFIGHQGGDDFVVICDYQEWEGYARRFIASFTGGIPAFYNKTDSQNGFIESVNRQGQRQRFPIMSVSVAAATNHHRAFLHPAEMIQVVTEIKGYLKRLEGSNYKIDSRQPRPHPQDAAGALAAIT